MLKGREIALTLRSSWIMNVVSINVCIINHISTNWTSVEPVGLSDMETGLDYCLCFRIKDHKSRMICSFLGGGDTQVEQAIALVPWPHFMRAGGDCFGQNEQIFVQFHTERQGKGGGNASRKWCCVYVSVSLCCSGKLLFSLLKQYSTLNTCGQGHKWPYNSI